MTGGERMGSFQTLRRVSATSVVLILVLAVAAYQFDLGSRWLGWGEPSPVAEPAEVAPPPGLDLPPAGTAPEVAETFPTEAAAPRKVRRALAPLIRDEDLGRRVAVAVSQLSDGDELHRSGPSRVIPASTMKLLTAASALESLGPDHRFRTTVVARPNARRVVLVGGGDPLLERTPITEDDVYPARANLQALARLTARALKQQGRTTVRLGYDATLFRGPDTSPGWRPSYVPDNVVSPISALWTNRGRDRLGQVTESRDPAADAAEAFARALSRSGVALRGQPEPLEAAAGMEELAVARSAPLEQIVQHTLEVSDNEAAEVLFRHAALATGRQGSFAGGAAAVRSILRDAGVPLSGARIVDGSGLSRRNLLRPETLLSVIELASSEERPEWRRVVTGLPVAGFTGSLIYRFETGHDRGPGSVRAKTGTLTGVHGLAGVVVDADGTELAFVAIADRVKVVDTLDARAAIDEMAAALAGCMCATT